jgi:hypothetical protein
MRFLLSEISYVTPFKVVAFISVYIAVVAEIAAALTLAFVHIAFPLTFTGSLSLFFICAPIAGLLVGLPIWWRFIAKPGHATIRRGIFLGILSGLVAHPVAWICFMVLSSLLGLDFTPSQSLPDFLSLLQGVIPFSLFGLVYVGWITVAVGGIAGGLLIVFMRRVSQQDNIEGEGRIRQ